MLNVFVQLTSRKMRWGPNTTNPKEYPYSEELISLLRSRYNVYVITEQPLIELVAKIRDEMDFFVSIDTFLPHAAHYYGKVGFVIFGQSDPNIFGYKENINILKDRNNLREKQFWNWEQTPYREDVFPTAQEVFEIINHYIEKTTHYSRGMESYSEQERI